MAAVAIEVPDYGETMIPDVAQDCENTWTKPANDFIEYELADPQPVFLYYLRAGSMQAYHAAALNQSTTNIVNVPLFKRRFASRQPWPGRPAAGAFRCLHPSAQSAGRMKTPTWLASKMHTLINYQAALNACLKDSASTGNLVGLRFLSSHLGYAPAIEQEDFTVYPALLT